MRWLPWEDRDREKFEEAVRVKALEMVEPLVKTRLAEALAQFPKKPEPRLVLVNFADLEEVEGYLVREVPPFRGYYVNPKTLVVTDDREAALNVVRKNPRMHHLKVVRLWKAPDGTLLWKERANLAYSPTGEVEADE